MKLLTILLVPMVAVGMASTVLARDYQDLVAEGYRWVSIDRDYSDPQASPTEAAGAEQTNIAVQQELAKLGFYHGQINGRVGPGMRQAITWFQTVEKLPVTGQVDGPTLDALQIR